MDKTYFTQKWMNAREEYDMCSRSSILDYYLKENDNLDLDQYRPYIKEFVCYSIDLFPPDNFITDFKHSMKE